MKKRLLVILISIGLFLLFAMSVYAADTAGTEVTAKADAVYVFAAPAGAAITYPQSQAGLGDFVVSDLFLESGEWLTVSVIPGMLNKSDFSGETLPYGLIFSPPGTLNQSDIGQRYSVAADIDPNAFENASAGTYQAILRFRVTSYPDGRVVWEGTSVLTVIRGGSIQSEPVYSGPSVSSQVTTSQPSSSVSTTSAPSVKSKSSTVTIVSEPIPGNTPEMGTVIMRYGFLVAVLALSALIVLTRVIGRRKKSD